MKAPLQTVLFSVLILLAGCDIFVNKPDSVKSIDISDAVYLGVDESGNNNTSYSLVKVVKDDTLNSLELVEFLDNERNFLGNDIIYADPWTIHPASEEYTILAGEFIFKVKGGEKRHFGLVLNNKTGEIFGLEDYYYPEPYYGLQGNYYYQTDSIGNIYFVNSDLYRILINDGTTLQLEKYMDRSAGIFDQRYLVDKYGNVYFQEGQRVKKYSGGIEETNMRFLAFNGTDGKCYGLRQEWPDQAYVMSLEVKNGEFISNKINDSGFYFEGGVGVSYQYFDYKNRRSIFITQGYFNPELVLDNEWAIGFIFDELTYKIIPLVIEESIFFEIVGLTEEHLWVKMNDRHYEAWDLSTVELESNGKLARIKENVLFEIPGEFDIATVNIIQQGDGLAINGFNLGTETKYTGIITVENGLEYFEQASESRIFSLTRIK